MSRFDIFPIGRCRPNLCALQSTEYSARSVAAGCTFSHNPLHSHYICDDLKMDPPMSDWFHSLPHALDGVASAAKVIFHNITERSMI